MIERHLRQIWDQLRSKKNQIRFFLEEARIKGLRGIGGLAVRFSYPVSVLAGPNASGKSTVLFALACAYKVPESGVKDFVPSTLFPNFLSRSLDHPSDRLGEAALEFHYTDDGQRAFMRWSRGKSWNRSYGGAKGARQPERRVYLRTLANLSNPSEVRSVLQLGRQGDLDQEEITAELLVFAQRVLPMRYRELLQMKRKDKEVLFARRGDAGKASYSEFHMSAGERSILRLSKDVSTYHGALLLIDEIEAGLHPATQQQLMLELQRLALRNDLQIVVTTHSPVVLDSVPAEGRIFLERTEDNVTVVPPYRDVIQKALYGRSIDKLSILCEDDVAESLVRGVLDIVNPRLDLVPSDVEVGHDTGKAEFPQHVRALAKLKRLTEFLFVLDGDARDVEASVRQAAEDHGQAIRLLFLPGERPEDWIWDQLKARTAEYAAELGTSNESFRNAIERHQRTFEGAASSQSSISKGRLAALADELAREVTEICRRVGRQEAERRSRAIVGFLDDLQDAILSWRSLR